MPKKQKQDRFDKAAVKALLLNCCSCLPAYTTKPFMCNQHRDIAAALRAESRRTELRTLADARRIEELERQIIGFREILASGPEAAEKRIEELTKENSRLVSVRVRDGILGDADILEVERKEKRIEELEAALRENIDQIGHVLDFRAAMWWSRDFGMLWQDVCTVLDRQRKALGGKTGE